MPHRKGSAASHITEITCEKCGTVHVIQSDSRQIERGIIASTGGIITDPTIVKCGCIIFI